ncbi:MAG: acyl-CoA dehydrogenase [Candidatus Eremiobacteraeota bacterium]|nr:acyl-CoA dehydrogenase [Candidatus Eremiobacteraeota bacterium]
MTTALRYSATLPYPIEANLLAYAKSSERGVSFAGRAREIAALRAVGYRDASLGRIYEGHLNGGQLVGRYGTPAQRAAAERDVDAGRLFGVWNTQDDDGVTIASAGDRHVLQGSKTWASGAGAVTRAVVTAARAGGGVQMCLVPLERVAATIDAGAWQPLGMHASQSFRVSFDGVRLETSDLIGGPDDYERQPWFFGGALRFAAVQTGVCERLFAETIDYVYSRGRHEDAYQLGRIADMRIAVESAVRWLEAGRAAWEAFDGDASDARGVEVIDVVDMVRTVVERAALSTIELAVRSVGARGLLEPLPFAKLVRDLEMYLRQPAPDAATVRIATSAVRRRIAARSRSIAASTAIVS